MVMGRIGSVQDPLVGDYDFLTEPILESLMSFHAVAVPH